MGVAAASWSVHRKDSSGTRLGRIRPFGVDATSTRDGSAFLARNGAAEARCGSRSNRACVDLVSDDCASGFDAVASLGRRRTSTMNEGTARLTVFLDAACRSVNSFSPKTNLRGIRFLFVKPNVRWTGRVVVDPQLRRLQVGQQSYSRQAGLAHKRDHGERIVGRQAAPFAAEFQGRREQCHLRGSCLYGRPSPSATPIPSRCADKTCVASVVHMPVRHLWRGRKPVRL